MAYKARFSDFLDEVYTGLIADFDGVYPLAGIFSRNGKNSIPITTAQVMASASVGKVRQYVRTKPAALRDGTRGVYLDSSAGQPQTETGTYAIDQYKEYPIMVEDHSFSDLLFGSANDVFVESMRLGIIEFRKEIEKQIINNLFSSTTEGVLGNPGTQLFNTNLDVLNSVTTYFEGDNVKAAGNNRYIPFTSNIMGNLRKVDDYTLYKIRRYSSDFGSADLQDILGNNVMLSHGYSQHTKGTLDVAGKDLSADVSAGDVELSVTGLSAGEIVVGDVITVGADTSVFYTVSAVDGIKLTLQQPLIKAYASAGSIKIKVGANHFKQFAVADTAYRIASYVPSSANINVFGTSNALGADATIQNIIDFGQSQGMVKFIIPASVASIPLICVMVQGNHQVHCAIKGWWGGKCVSPEQVVTILSAPVGT